MNWYEHLLGILALGFCFVAVPCAFIAYCACVVSGEISRMEGD